jgi:hypothetical protein
MKNAYLLEAISIIIVNLVLLMDCVCSTYFLFANFSFARSVYNVTILYKSKVLTFKSFIPLLFNANITGNILGLMAAVL